MHITYDLGDGALITGIGTWFKAHSPKTKVVGVVAQNAPSIDDIVQVLDEATIAAMRLVYSFAGIVVEPAGAVGLAAAMTFKERLLGQMIATPLCGSNMTMKQIARWL